ncbi:hypothetical protein SD71_06225 [Cohnella kolymensis]|uniref:DUF1648 domain-containing protein n=1 Tax=Cohnella kolymensis TaxID=1590652 RepID=A0ABR5A6F9_9BACL|nr:hypothetical protein [Cohnella kolymensis]KIL36613.1 hypothetical protein SD71_06225 [Cohnella kolymensis]
MNEIIAKLELGCALLLLILAWKAGSKAAHLSQGGSVERLNRKTRKMLFWSLYVTLPACAMIVVMFSSLPSLEPVLWEERVLLHIPLVAAPLLAVLLLAVPRLWILWRETGLSTGAPLPSYIFQQAAHPSVIVPFQMTALGAVTVFYFTLASPAPLSITKAIVPIVVWFFVSAGLWIIYERRWKQAAKPDTKAVPSSV